jgi:hypothetical protein
MIRRLILHANKHSIGYVALVCSLLALGGASYAAIKIPNGSVGTKQIKNGAVGEKQLKNKSIDPVKWDPTYVTSFVRRWANVDANGKYLSGAPHGSSTAQAAHPGTFELTWGDAFKNFCAPVVSVDSTPASGTTAAGGGFANANIVTQSGNATAVFVHTYDIHGNAAPEPFSIAIICPKGAGGGATFPYTLP